MPIYDFHCDKCQNRFELLVGVTAGDSELRCPKCGAAEIRKRPSTFGVSVKSSSSCSTGTCSTGACPTCY
jgi:putative FmdB family regulatory protein